MVCPSCNSINTGENCFVHNVITCVNCLYDGVNSTCDSPSFIAKQTKFKKERDAEYDKILSMIPKGNMWTPQ